MKWIKKNSDFIHFFFLLRFPWFFFFKYFFQLRVAAILKKKNLLFFKKRKKKNQQLLLRFSCGFDKIFKPFSASLCFFHLNQISTKKKIHIFFSFFFNLNPPLFIRDLVKNLHQTEISFWNWNKNETGGYKDDVM